MTWPPALSFGTVLERARAHDKQATGLLYKRFLPVVYRFVLARVGDAHHAEDITADTFFAMIESIGTTRAQGRAGVRRLGARHRAQQGRPALSSAEEYSGGSQRAA
jgi:DNA-directed RNA polymerase specialized sigma subunit, sigma24 homolog